MMNSRFHACATCIHFRPEKSGDSLKYYCARLGFETKTHYQFDCWNPRENIKKLMARESQVNGE
ncbi:hypothetical protein AABM38_15160 [Heyndrickxia sp. MSNUG]|uniref:hypothetical protein n=1 Tax=Heyndrickxia sp. MSNUG TaxID=3136677 RepID=UPI003C2B1473